MYEIGHCKVKGYFRYDQNYHISRYFLTIVVFIIVVVISYKCVAFFNVRLSKYVSLPTIRSSIRIWFFCKHFYPLNYSLIFLPMFSSIYSCVPIITARAKLAHTFTFYHTSVNKWHSILLKNTAMKLCLHTVN